MALNIADLFEHAVDVAPDNPAVQVGDRVITYAELEADANKLAHFLQSHGIGPGDHVGVYAKNSIEHVIALIAILKIRAVAINVNYRYVAGELDYLFDNADLVALVHERVYAPLVAACAPKHEKLTPSSPCPDRWSPTTTRPLVLRRRALGRGARRPVRRARLRRAQPRRPPHHLHRRHDRLPQGRHVAPRGLLAGARRRHRLHHRRAAGGVRPVEEGHRGRG